MCVRLRSPWSGGLSLILLPVPPPVQPLGCNLSLPFGARQINQWDNVTNVAALLPNRTEAGLSGQFINCTRHSQSVVGSVRSPPVAVVQGSELCDKETIIDATPIKSRQLLRCIALGRKVTPRLGPGQCTYDVAIYLQSRINKSICHFEGIRTDTDQPTACGQLSGGWWGNFAE